MFPSPLFKEITPYIYVCMLRSNKLYIKRALPRLQVEKYFNCKLIASLEHTEDVADEHKV